MSEGQQTRKCSIKTYIWKNRKIDNKATKRISWFYIYLDIAFFYIKLRIKLCKS